VRGHAPERRGARGVHRAEPSGQGWGCGTAASLSSHAALGMGGDERGVDVQGGAGGAAARLLDVLEDGLDGEAGHLSHILLRRTRQARRSQARAVQTQPSGRLAGRTQRVGRCGVIGGRTRASRDSARPRAPQHRTSATDEQPEFAKCQRLRGRIPDRNHRVAPTTLGRRPCASSPRSREWCFFSNKAYTFVKLMVSAKNRQAKCACTRTGRACRGVCTPGMAQRG